MDSRVLLDLGKADEVIRRCGKEPQACIPILQQLQEVYGYLPAAALDYVASRTNISRRQLYGVATFYGQFRFAPVGRHIIRVCHGTACHVNGAKRISTAMEEILGIKDRETTDDGLFTLETVACLGCCSLAPVMMIDDRVYGRLTTKEIKRIIKSYQQQNHPEAAR